MSPEPRIHPSAAVGFERGVADYERGRPGFPDEAVRFLVERLGLASGRTCLELGAGTGKLTALLVPSGAQIVAVEPVAAMRAALTRTVPEMEVIGATAEDLPLGDRSADAAAAAQAFHWFDGDRALLQLARVLRPGARLGLVWNVRDEETLWVRAMTGLIEPYRGDAPAYRSMRWLEAFQRTTAFMQPVRRSFAYVQRTTADRAASRALSISFIAALPDDERRHVADEIGRLLPPGDELAFPYRTDVWISELR